MADRPRESRKEAGAKAMRRHFARVAAAREHQLTLEHAEHLRRQQDIIDQAAADAQLITEAAAQRARETARALRRPYGPFHYHPPGMWYPEDWNSSDEEANGAETPEGGNEGAYDPEDFTRRIADLFLPLPAERAPEANPRGPVEEAKPMPTKPTGLRGPRGPRGPRRPRPVIPQPSTPRPSGRMPIPRPSNLPMPFPSPLPLFPPFGRSAPLRPQISETLAALGRRRPVRTTRPTAPPRSIPLAQNNNANRPRTTNELMQQMFPDGPRRTPNLAGTRRRRRRGRTAEREDEGARSAKRTKYQSTVEDGEE